MWQRNNKLVNLMNFRSLSVLLIYIIIIITFIFTAPRTFLGSRIYLAFLSTVPFSLIMGLSLTFIITAGEIDLSFPGIMTFSGFLFSYIYITLKNPLLGLIVCVASGAAIGLINGILVSKVKVPSLIVTLSTSYVWSGLALVLSSGKTIALGDMRGTIFQKMFVGRIGGFLPAQSLWALGLAVLLSLIFNRHRFGEHVMFVGDNREATRMLGVNVDWTIILVFVLMGVLSAFSSLLLSLEMAGWWPTSGPGYLLPTIAAVFIGGTSIYGGEGTIFGTVIGAFIIGSLTAGIVASGVEEFWTRLVVGLVMLVAVLLNIIVNRRVE
jgi:simple sugar transport system permease protein